MATSAKCSYRAVRSGSVFNYEVRFENTSPVPFDIYAFLFGQHYNEPLVLFPLQDILLTQLPPGWLGHAEGEDIGWFTDWQGSSIATGYIMPGHVGTFLFQSSTAPPPKIVFGCVYYDNANSWGYAFNGTAELRDPARPARVIPTPLSYNPQWAFETHGGRVPPGPPPAWLQQMQAAIMLAGNAGSVSPQLRAKLLELALEQTQIASATLRQELSHQRE